MQEKFIVSVDMGGTKILASVLNSKKGIIARQKKPTNTESGTKVYVKDIAELITKVVVSSKLKKQNIVAVCLGVPGSVNPKTGIIGLAPNLGIKNYNMKAELEKLIPYPVLLENDVNLGALGVKNYGIGKSATNMLAVFVGTGIGGGVVIDKKMYRGFNFVAGEIGHMLVQKNGPKCGCGKKGCFEAIASRTAVVNNIIYDIKKLKKKSVLADLVKSNQRIKSGSLKNAIAKKDKVVIKRITESCETIGGVLASVCNLMNFDMIVLGGGVIEALGNFMMPIIKREFQNHVFDAAAKGVKIVASKLGDDAAIYGGLALAEEFLGVKI
ncbi:MAG: ROK family protein [Ignavibacteriaceae bacterium]|nr:ROK family protein [Ignavibacteriaceae bacterium]HMN25652.1 ROK family protein [Ignavibacteriaceae bacterium]HRN24997.1 ROK family protein [Ignavibacteriaceae bacterium]HRP94160.1 ROK family protein [Ignavibacteriaceae bacterium]HRQ52623.1 ROK family protein [Ignavibacteriaceae bacterium]